MNKFIKIVVGIIVISFIGYAGLWYTYAYQIKKTIKDTQNSLFTVEQAVTLTDTKTSVAGFPKAPKVSWSGTITSNEGVVKIPEISVKSWFAKGRPIDIMLPSGISIKRTNGEALDIERIDLSISMPKNWPGNNASHDDISAWQKLEEKVDFHYFGLDMGEKGFKLSANGHLNLDDNLQPAGIINLKLDDVRLIEEMKNEIKQRIESDKTLKPQDKVKLSRQHGTLSALTSTKDMNYTIRIVNNAVYLSFLKLSEIPKISWRQRQPSNTEPSAPMLGQNQ